VINRGDIVSMGSTDRIGVAMEIKRDVYCDANPIVRVKWIRDLEVEWLRSEHLYLVLDDPRN
jgi:hypothetical protein